MLSITSRIYCLFICLIVVAATVAFTDNQSNGKEIKGGTFIDDRDSATYKTIKIGNQVWMSENLKFNSENSSCPDFKERPCSKFGRFYTFDEALKACPNGWHLPDQNEWDILINNLGGNTAAITHLKRGGSSKFEAPLAGVFAHRVGQLLGFGEWEIFWAALEKPDTQEAFTVYFHHKQGITYHFNTKFNYFCVRCLKD